MDSPPIESASSRYGALSFSPADDHQEKMFASDEPPHKSP